MLGEDEKSKALKHEMKTGVSNIISITIKQRAKTFIISTQILQPNHN
jgi:hypothetical protein